ncbi:MAG: ATP-dependent DNA helicase RecG [Gammaproteobacteria bacterium]|nr:ATP-dependent DNA helicase RecG [Gammaproteobacteria bacterium]
MNPPVTTATDNLDALPVTVLKGVGPRMAGRLERLGIRTVQDVLFHLPQRYEDRTRIMPMGALRPGDQAVVQGEVELAEVRFGRRRSLLVRISDGTGSMTLRFFHFSAAQQAGFVRGAGIRCYGEVRAGPATAEMIHPEYRLIEAGTEVPVEEHLTPVYPATEGVHQLTLRSVTTQALQYLDGQDDATSTRLPDWLPVRLIAPFRMTTLPAALRYVHRPPPQASVALLAEGRHPAQQRLAFEELLAHHLSLRRVRLRAQHTRAPVITGGNALVGDFIASLPFALTAAQQRVFREIRDDLACPHPMARLVQGDVGSGKTVVAACAAMTAVQSGYQVALMAPTELLAEQHYRSFRDWLEPLGIGVAWHGGKSRGKERASALQAIRDGVAAVAVGTHALFQEEVEFDRLGLVIIDEQHRFGVHQRLALRDKGRSGEQRPHQLVMTATPIPRTLAMTVYADLDTSVIDELPPGRLPVTTVVISQERRVEVMQRVRAACTAGQQAYWVCTLIEESEALQCQAAEKTAEFLTESLPDVRIALVHGRLKAADKERVMAAFKAGTVDLLVATTVIEVGVDVPNATLMIIENPERLGLAQLHQLRGRVGRGRAQSNCVLLYQPPLSETARARLAVLRDSNDGFEIARRDMELRGPGEVLGTRQTGEMKFHIADLLRDEALLAAVEQVALQLLECCPDHVSPLIRRWLGDTVQYGEV